MYYFFSTQFRFSFYFFSCFLGGHYNNIRHIIDFSFYEFKERVKKSFVFKEKYTQPVIRVGYEKIIPSIKTPMENVYLANMSQVYPWDRGANYAVEIGKKVAKMISAS